MKNNMSKNGKLIFKDYDPYITSPFGWRKDPINGQTKYHNGTDYGTYGKELPQYAIEKGKVIGCGTDGQGGKYVYVRYDRLGYIGLHYHLSKISVINGQNVDENTKIGNTGTTGRSTGVHLHYGWFKSSEWGKSDKKFEDFELYEYKKEEPKPKPTPVPSRYAVGDKVKIIGKGNGSSDGKSNVAYGIGLQKEIIKIYANRAFPYQVGDNITTIGFYKEDALELVNNVPVPSATISLGDTVIVNGFGTASSSGIGAKTKVYKNTKMKVLAIFKSAKQPYALNQNNAGTIGNFRDVTAWFNASDVKKQ